MTLSKTVAYVFLHAAAHVLPMKRLYRAIVINKLFAVVALLLVSVLWHQPLFLTGVLIGVSGAALYYWSSKEYVYLYISAAIGGAVAEAVAIASGAWDYAIANMGDIPYWLPFLWGLAAIYIQRSFVAIHSGVDRSGDTSTSEEKGI